MPTVADVVRTLSAIAPPALALPSDRIGLQVGDPGQSVQRALVALDASGRAIADALAGGCQLMVTHHPVIWNPARRVVRDDVDGARAWALARAGLSLVAAHTNWDAARGGVNDELARRLGLVGMVPFGPGASAPRWKLVVFVPRSHGPAVLDAAAAAGAGTIGGYDRCAFIGTGMGTFRPGPGARPAIGTVGQVEQVAEDRIEVRVPDALRSEVERAVRAAHPYEEPALDWVRLDDGTDLPLGRVGDLAQPKSLRQFATHVGTTLETKTWTWGAPNQVVERIAVVGGSGGGEWEAAWRAGAQVLVAGEVKHDEAIAAGEAGMAVMAAGHYATEHPGVEALAERLGEACPEVEWRVFAPNAGDGGRSW